MGICARRARVAFNIKKLHMEERERFPTAPSRGRPGEYVGFAGAERVQSFGKKSDRNRGSLSLLKIAIWGAEAESRRATSDSEPPKRKGRVLQPYQSITPYGSFESERLKSAMST